MNTHLTVELMIQKENKVFMIRRHNTGYMDGNYAFVGGHVERGESLEQAIIREAKEECGIDIQKENLEYICGIRDGKRDDYINFFYRVTKFSGEPQNTEPQECDKIIWADIDNLPENIVPNDKRAIYNYFNGIKIDEYNF